MNTYICIYACLFICRHQRTLWRLTQLWTIQQSAHPGTYSGNAREMFSFMDLLMKMLGRRRESNFKKGVSLFLFNFLFHFFFIKLILYTNSSLLLLFIETILIIPSIKEDQEGIQESLCLSVCLSVSADSYPVRNFFLAHMSWKRVTFSDHFLSAVNSSYVRPSVFPFCL